MDKRQRVTWLLVGHFFRRFFDNDTIQVDGDTLTTVARAAAAVAVPGLIVAFFLQNQYPRRSLWGSIEDQYFFVLISFVVMGLIAVFEWQMLFPDRLDFLILSPLALRPWQMLTAKATALAGFLGLFLMSSNLLGTLTLAAVSKDAFWHHVLAHAVAALLAGVFAALFVVALGGVLLCVLDETRFRVASPVMQMVCVLALVLCLLQYAQYGDAIEQWLGPPSAVVRWLPPVWFLALYERLLHGGGAPAFAQELAPYALRGTAIVSAVAVLTYPVAWARVRRMAVEGSSRQRGGGARWRDAVVHRLVRRPGERAVFHFIGQTMTRNNRYQVYLAMYWGAGLAIATACAVRLPMSAGRTAPELSQKGLHAVMPLLLFWTVAGLRMAFGFPLNLPAGWVFRCTGVSMRECADAARIWVLGAALGAMLLVLAVLAGARWGLRQMLVQVVCGLCLCVVLTYGFFFFQRKVPFNQPRMPGRTSLPLMLTLYVGVLPTALFGMVRLELMTERRLAYLLVVVAVTVAMYASVAWLNRGPDEVEEEMEGYEGEFQLLGLS
jgi:hypothetical protein